MTPDATNILRVMADGRWRSITDVALRAGLSEPRALAALEALVADGRLIRERVHAISIYRNGSRE